MSEKQYRDKITQLTKQRSDQEKISAKARAAGNKLRADATKELARINSRTSESSARTYQRHAERLSKNAEAEDGKVAAASAKLSQIARDLASAETSLEREQGQTANRENQRRKQQIREAEQADTRRQQRERSHAREIARLSRPTVRVVHEVREVTAPQPEGVRILYLTANPEMNLRTEAESRAVRQSVRKSTHRDSVQVEFRPAATPEDLLEGLNEIRPHVVHFSGHSGDAALLFDDASFDAPEGRSVTYGLLARALGATDQPPTLLVLNGCDTLSGAEELLVTVGAVIATSTSISDVAAAVFATKFYAAIAEAQPIAAALEQGRVGVDFLGLNEGWKPDVLARPEIDLSTRVLIQP